MISHATARGRVNAWFIVFCDRTPVTRMTPAPCPERARQVLSLRCGRRWVPFKVLTTLDPWILLNSEFLATAAQALGKSNLEQKQPARAASNPAPAGRGERWLRTLHALLLTPVQRSGMLEPLPLPVKPSYVIAKCRP